MSQQGQFHSRLVAWLKVVLPLIALAILSTLFLLSRRIETDGTLPYADVDVNELAREQRLAAPRFATVTADGASLSVSASMARPDTGGTGAATAEALSANIEVPGGVTMHLTSDAGRLDPDANRVEFSGNVRVATSTGYQIDSPALWASLDRTRLEADGPVVAISPMGRIDAGGMTLSAQGGGYVLVFNDGVKLIYEPKP